MFLASIFRECSPDSIVEVRDLPDGGGRPTTHRLAVAELGTATLPMPDGNASRYYGVCTRRPETTRGRLEDLDECPALWADIDTLKRGMCAAKSIRDMSSLPMPPTVVVDTGGGVHAYWVLTEPAVISDEGEADRLVHMLKGLCVVVDGDPAVCDLPRVMRLPGSVNIKPAVISSRGGTHRVRMAQVSGKRHHLCEIQSWLEWQRPMAAPASDTVSVGVHNLPGRQDRQANMKFVFQHKVDPITALQTMRWGADGERGVHITQLRVSAAMARLRIPVDGIVAAVLEATRTAAGPGVKWNWTKEEEQIRAMTVSAVEKFVDQVE